MENKWRAARYGLDGKLIDFGKQTEVPARDLIGEILDFVDDVVDELGSRQEIGYIRRILEEGSGADRQLRVFARPDDLKKVVDYMIEETQTGYQLRRRAAGEVRYETDSRTIPFDPELHARRAQRRRLPACASSPTRRSR